MYGFPFSLVRAAVISRIFSGEDVLMGMPAFGEFRLRNGRWYYLMEIGAGQPPMEMEVEFGFPAGGAVTAGSCHREFILHDRETGEYRLLTAFGKSEKEAERALDREVVQAYFERHKIGSVVGVRRLLRWFRTHLAELETGGSGIAEDPECCSEPVIGKSQNADGRLWFLQSGVKEEER